MPPLREKLLDSAILLGMVSGLLVFIGRLSLESRLQGLDLSSSFAHMDVTDYMVLGAADLLGLLGTLVSAKAYAHGMWRTTLWLLGCGLVIGYGAWKKKHLVTAYGLFGLGVAICGLIMATERLDYAAKGRGMDTCLRTPACAKAEVQLAVDDRTSRTVRGVFADQSADFVLLYTGAGYEACPKTRLQKLLLPAHPGQEPEPGPRP